MFDEKDGNVIAEKRENPKHIGFLTAVGDYAHGVIGGLLVLDLVGRPLEYHCTEPFRPNRVQEILFGPSLDGFVWGEQIAVALVSRSKVDLSAVLTNTPKMLPAAEKLNTPLGLVLSHVQSNETVDAGDERFAVWKKNDDQLKKEVAINRPESGEELLEAGEKNGNDMVFFYPSLSSLPPIPGVDYSLWQEFVRGQNKIALKTGDSQTTESLVEVGMENIEPFLKSIDSVEPFERIRLAIDEAQKAS